MQAHKLRFLATALAAAGLVVACENAYTYVPTTGATTTIAGRAAAQYPLPAETPQGSLDVASFGFADVSAQESNERLAALHLRMVIVNNSDHDWTIDTREQRLDLDGHGVSAPSYASADRGSAPPVITVPPAGKRTVDLFFVLPSDMQTAERLPTFDAVWRVNVGTQIITGRTPFERLVVEPPDYGYGYDYYWGPPYWYDPYPLYTFHGAVVVPPHLHHGPVIMNRGGFHGGGFHGGGFHGGAPHGGGHR